MQILNLNVDCLLLIFSHLSINEHVRLRVVCKQWKNCIEKEIFKRKRTLQVFPNQRSIIEYSLKNFQFSNKKQTIIAQNCYIIQKLFPNLVYLQIYFAYQHTYLDLHQFLPKLFQTLQTLYLTGHFKPNLSLCLSICKSINQLKYLKSLHLQTKNFFTSENYKTISIQLNSSIISNLESFSFSDYFGDLTPFFGDFQKLKYLHLEHETIVSQLPEMFQHNPKIAKQITHLSISPLNNNLIQFINEQKLNCKITKFK